MNEIPEGQVRLRIALGYDGTNFHGWATQPGLRTVQQTLEDAINSVCGSPETPMRLTVAGRTDAGVHAREQIAHLDIDERLAERLTARRLNAVLKRDLRDGAGGARGREFTPDLVVHGVEVAPVGFDARFSALTRRYAYRISPGGVRRDPLTARYTAAVPMQLDLNQMQQASDALLGLQDFAAFCKAREGATTIRELLAFAWAIDDAGVYIARIEADAFCHSMVRALVGSVVAVGSERITQRDLISIRDARERTSRFTVMPAHGLALEAVTYPPDDELAERAEQTRAKREPFD